MTQDDQPSLQGDMDDNPTLGVTREGGGGGVGLPTLLTLERFLPAVGTPVNFQIVQFGKRRIALLTRIRLGPAMSQHVTL